MLGSTSITLTIGATPYVLSKINTPAYASEYFYKDANRLLRLKVRHSTTNDGYDRHNVEVVHTIFEVPETSPEIVRKAYFVIEQLPTDNDVGLLDALADLAIATSNDLIDDLMEWKV